MSTASCWLTQAQLCLLQAKRLVKNSIISIEAPEADIDDVDSYEDVDEVAGFVAVHRRRAEAAAATAAETGGVVV